MNSSYGKKGKTGPAQIQNESQMASNGGGQAYPSVRTEPVPQSANGSNFSAEESEGLLRIVEQSSRIKRHFELYELLQGEVQRFIPHQIFVSAWGDFSRSDLNLDVVSAGPGIRTAKIVGCDLRMSQMNSCGVDRVIKELFRRWLTAGRRPLLDGAANKQVSHSDCICPLFNALHEMWSVLVHGVHDQRTGSYNLYVALNRGSMLKGRSVERFCSLADLIIAQIDVALQKVPVLRCAGVAAPQITISAPHSNGLSVREQDIMKWLYEGRTNSEIASHLGISHFTVKNHMRRIFTKLRASNRTEALVKYQQQQVRPS